MLNAFVCGSFNHEEDDGPSCPNSSPKKSKRKDSRDNNPYSSRGLDKFSALLADLDERRQKVYSQMSPHDISFVRFAYSNTDDFVPIVVKVKNNKSEELKVRHMTSFSDAMEIKSNAIEATGTNGEELRNHAKLESENNKDEKQKKKLSKSLYFSWNMLKRPSFYVPAVMMLILVLLTVFGRSVATLCTCVMWYVVPTLSDSADSSSSSKQRKTYIATRKAGEHNQSQYI